jgi:type VII secretion protein EccE
MLARTLAATGQAGVLLQVVSQGNPAPAATVHPTTPAARSYRDLLTEVGSGPAPVDRVRWLVVRLEARLLAVAGAVGDVSDRAPAVAAALLRRAVRTLQRVGLTVTPLDGPGLLAAVHHCCGLDEGRDTPREEWGGWHSGQLTHVTYWISQWPAPAQVPALLRTLAEVPAAQTTISTTIAVPPADLSEDTLDAPLGEAELRCLVRIAVPSERVAEVHAAVLQCADGCGARVHRLDGEHAPAVYATAPTGGGPW